MNNKDLPIMVAVAKAVSGSSGGGSSLPEGSENQILTYKNNEWTSAVNGNSNVNNCVAEVEAYGKNKLDVTVNTSLYPNFRAICDAIDTGAERGMLKIWDDMNNHYLEESEVYVPFCCMRDTGATKLYFWNFNVLGSNQGIIKGYFYFNYTANTFSYIVTT